MELQEMRIKIPGVHIYTPKSEKNKTNIPASRPNLTILGTDIHFGRARLNNAAAQDRPRTPSPGSSNNAEGSAGAANPVPAFFDQRPLQPEIVRTTGKGKQPQTTHATGGAPTAPSGSTSRSLATVATNALKSGDLTALTHLDSMEKATKECMFAGLKNVLADKTRGLSKAVIGQYVQLMSDPNFSPLKPGGNSTQLLTLAVRAGDLAVFSALLAHPKINVDAKNLRGDIALQAAAVLGRHDMARMLIEANANAAIATDDRTPSLGKSGEPAAYLGKGAIPLHVAAYKGDAQMARLLLSPDFSDTVNNKTVGLGALDQALGRDVTALHIAAANGNPDLVKLLLEVPGIEVRPQNSRGLTPLDLAQNSGHAGVVALLQTAQANERPDSRPPRIRPELRAILGVERHATDEQVRRAYITLSRQHHPDKPGGNEELYKQISNAYDELKKERPGLK
ncbi:ankyrin repeat domain-containing protein [Aquincola sp. S2]|uniref:Ankyrin repeat domain-containing protein n=1 Tax=Pseudaquabacterium terrae TaxID=2732868 RepID=A0ABX2EU88_9BURK|nr:ankyrin repeat domain-containing protein [Aquabacterium terrae]NRF72201.1 ankyrin repeat domain-containing protein [Aquabacterium terrae]